MGSGPRLLSVNVGLPRDIQWNGRTVHTAIWKRPVAGRVRVRRLNLDGDGQGDLGGHGGEQRGVLVYQLASYDHWARALGMEGLPPGAFGENFTVEGLPDDEVCIGDRFSIGTALLEVTAPRVTCYRVGLRLREPRMAALLVEHGRPGFYLRVLREGEVAAGDDALRGARAGPAVTGAAIDALLYLPGRSRVDLQRAVTIPALSPGWRQSFADLLQPSATPVSRSAWPRFRALRVTALRHETDEVVSVLLDDPSGAPLPPH